MMIMMMTMMMMMMMMTTIMIITTPAVSGIGTGTSKCTPQALNTNIHRISNIAHLKCFGQQEASGILGFAPILRILRRNGCCASTFLLVCAGSFKRANPTIRRPHNCSTERLDAQRRPIPHPQSKDFTYDM